MSRFKFAPEKQEPRDDWYAELSVEKSKRNARERGCVIRVPKDNELFIDIDSEEAFNNFNRAFPLFQQRYLCQYSMNPSPSGKPWRRHVVVTLGNSETVTPLERIMFQALLGSDPIREMISWRRLENDCATPTLFFEKKP